MKPMSARCSRRLRFDILESRRLLAGLDVWVFHDSDNSRSFESNREFGVPRQVVYVDLNSNASHDSGEPIAISNMRGVASFPDLQSGTYAIRLLGDHPSRLQTSPVVPSERGVQINVQDLDSIIQSISTGNLIGVAGNRLQTISPDGNLIHSVSMPGNVIDVVWSGSTGLVLVEVNQRPSLYTVQGQHYSMVGIDASDVRGMTAVGDSFYLYRETVGLVKVGSANTGVAYQAATGGQFQSLSSLGSDRIVLEELIAGHTRLSVHRIGPHSITLESERIFDSKITSWQTSPAGDAIFVESGNGVQILDVISGLPTKELLSGSAGPILFDAMAGLLYTGLVDNASSLQSWSQNGWVKGEQVKIDSQAMVGTLAGLTLTHDGRYLVGASKSTLFLQSLTSPTSLSVNVEDDSRASISIGLRLVGANRDLESIPVIGSWSIEEDQSGTLSLSDVFARSVSSPQYAILLTQPTKGQIEWSVETGGVYVPHPNAEGADSVLVAWFDGRNWTPSQRVLINIRPANDPPSGIVLPSKLEVLENVPGGVVGSIFVEDVDAESSYVWEVDDPRFEVKDGQLKLKDDTALNQAGIVSLAIRAIDATSGSSQPFMAQTTASLKVLSNPKQSIFHVADQYSAPEKTPGVSLGYVYVTGKSAASSYAISVSDSRFEVVNGAFKLKDSSSLSWKTDDTLTLTLTATSSGETLTKNTLIRVIPNSVPDPYDVDGDGKLTPIDILVLVNHINQHGPSSTIDPVEGEPSGGMDPDGDGQITPIDVLILINQYNQSIDPSYQTSPPRLNPKPTPEAEGEGTDLSLQYLDDIAPDVKGAKRSR